MLHRPAAPSGVLAALFSFFCVFGPALLSSTRPAELHRPLPAHLSVPSSINGTAKTQLGREDPPRVHAEMGLLRHDPLHDFEPRSSWTALKDPSHTSASLRASETRPLKNHALLSADGDDFPVADMPASIAEREVLLAFKAGISRDPLNVLASWTSSGSSFPCNGSWPGVECDLRGRVVSLDLHARNLTGFITPFLANLTMLTHLNLSINSLTGPIPMELGRLASLTHLDLKENILTGTIPPEIGNCTSLLWLDLSKNQLNGGLPTSLGQLSDLYILQLHDLPSLTGPIPFQFGNMTNLEYLYLGSNSLIGNIPPQLGNLGKLKELILMLNNLNGSIPAELGRLESLEYLSLFMNKFQGSIPRHLGNLTNLKYLYCLLSDLEGQIPVELGNLHNLIELDLSLNFAISGAIPAELGQLKNLQVLKLFQMNLTGAIPRGLGNLTKLEQFYAFSNQLSGVIPPEMGQLRGLRDLQLYFNQLSGPLPLEHTKLQNLQNLILFSNRLNGTVLPELGDMQSLSSLYLGDNAFTGNLPNTLGNLENLEYFEVSPNLLRGSIPQTLGRLKSLIYIDLSKNKFSGTLPKELANCKKLQWLKLSNNSLSGEVPVLYNSFPELHTLALGNNGFNGSLPANFVNHSSLLVLDLQRNEFSGQLPDSWALLENLRVLSVGYNLLRGSLPTWLWSLSKLQLINLANNNFSGAISSNISKADGMKYNDSVVDEQQNLWKDDVTVDLKGSVVYFKYLLTVVISIDFSGNLLYGTIPEEIGLLTGLFNLNLSDNTLSGPIPDTLASVSTLESLDLSSNHLSGEIPFQLINLTSLAFFNLSNNQLSGKIPRGKQFDSFTNQSYLGNANLCGYPLTVECTRAKNQYSTVHRSSIPKGVIIGVCISAVTVFALLVALACFLGLKNRKTRKSVFIQIFDKRVTLDLKELLAGTNNFSDANVIGRGGSCTVYRGVLSNMVVAVKKLDRLSQQEGQKSFVSESTVLGQIRHRNLVRILGSLRTPYLRCLLLEYISNGNLDVHLHEKEFGLSWHRRFQVALGVAQGLSYLHEETGVGQVLHCDLKPSNILLDQDYEPHISDFGIARLICAGKDGDSAVEAFRGSFGYIAPEYAYGGKITAKGDVYSFGIVLLEMLSRKRPTSNAFSDETSMTLWVEDVFHTNWIDLIDPALHENLEDERLKQEIYSVLVIAMGCVKRAPMDRPSMMDVLNALLCVRHGKPCEIPVDQLLSSSASDKYGLSFFGDTITNSSSALTELNTLSSSYASSTQG